MPIFEYACSACKHRFEFLMQTRAEKDKVQCPRCSSRKVEKQFSPFGVAMAESPRPKSPGKAGGGPGPCMPHGCGCA